MKRQWKYQTNNHHYFSQMCWADRLFNINGIMCVLTFSNCLGTFRTENFIMPLVLQCSFQKILPAWNKCMTLDFLVRRPQINLPFKEAFPVFKSDRNFRQTWNIHLYLYQFNFHMYQIIALIKLEWRLTILGRIGKNVLFPAASLLFSNIQFPKHIHQIYRGALP